MLRFIRKFQWLCSLVALGCTGTIAGTPQGEDDSTAAGETPGPSGTAGSGTPGGPGEEAPAAFTCNAEQKDPGPAPLKRLTAAQYINTVKVAFGDIVDLSTVFTNIPAHGHIGLVQPDVSQFDVETYAAAAAKVAAAVVTNSATFAPCAAPDALDSARACATEFVSTYGPRVFRSPLDAAGVSRLIAIFDVGYGNSGYSRGLELVVQALLESPRFLYRPELGQPATAGAASVPLQPHELASRLSFAFWNSGPDAELLAEAASGALATDAGIDAAAARLMADPRANDSFREFLYAWFGVGDLAHVVKDAAAFPAWQDTTAAAMDAQAAAFFDSILFGENGTVSALFTAAHDAFAPAELAPLYQSRPAGSPGGILTLPALLTVHSKPTESFPIYRGVFVREQLLCQPLPPPPPDVPMPPQPEPGVSTRERFEQHSALPACSGCHQLIDPIGFAFENYDGIGYWREQEAGKAIDLSGALVNTDSDGPFVGVGELADKLAQSPQARACVARQWFRYVMERFEQEADGCTMTALMNDFSASEYRLSSLRTSIVKTEAFRTRRPIVLEAP